MILPMNRLAWALQLRILNRALVLPVLIAFTGGARAQHPVIQSVLNEVRIDSMMHWVNELSGEAPVTISGAGHTLLSRHKNNAGNDLAQAWLMQKFVEMGYAPVVQSFSTTGKNILVTKPGDGSTDEVVIICAHYDAMPGGNLNAPAADDDGSGVCAVLEAARVLRDVPFVHPIVFALWDEEEQGKIGSIFYAGGMAANDALIRGVINMDAIAYDGNGDRKARVHARPIANSIEIADTVFAVLDHYGIDIDLIMTNPGATYSDHASFWTEGYGAVLIIEEFTSDGNPQYHTPNDRVQYFDVPYYEKLAKLSIASTATLAVPVGEGTSVDEPGSTVGMALLAFPNPSADQATLFIDHPVGGRASLDVFDALGRCVGDGRTLILPAGRSSFQISLDDYPAGGYIVRVKLEQGGTQSTRIVKLP